MHEPRCRFESPNEYRISFHDVTVGDGSVYPGKELAINPGQVFGELEGQPTKDPTFGLDAIWIDSAQRDDGQAMGFTVVDCGTVIATHLSQLLKNQAYEDFVEGIKAETKGESLNYVVEDGIFKLMCLDASPELEKVSGDAVDVNGKTIWKRANGIDNPPIIAFHERKSLSTERTYTKDTIDIKKLKETIFAMAENLAYQLRKGDKLAATISVKIRYSDFNTYSKQIKIPYTSADHIIIPTVLELFQKLYQRRLLIRLVGVKVSDIVSGNYQINLFDDTEQMLNLYNAMDSVRNKYGEKSIMRAAAMGAKSIGRFNNPFNGNPPLVLAHRKQ